MRKALLLSAGAALATAIGPAAIGQTTPVFKAHTDLVVLHVTVTDRHGAYVGGLPPDAFRVFEEDRPQAVRFFAPADTPVTVGLLIDSSGSMIHVRDRVIAASASFIDSSNPLDESFAVVFNDDVTRLPVSTGFFSGANTLRSALETVFVPAGRTKLYDAIVEGLSYVATGMRDRRVLVVLSDGGDNASRTTFADLLTSTRASNVVLYTIALLDPLDEDADPKRLKQLAETSGGSAFNPRDVAGVAQAFEWISRDVRSSYTLGYQPSDTDARPGLRRLRVEVHAPDGRRLVTRTRNAYIAGQPIHFPHDSEAGHAR